ncbi:Aste57867_7924 [Aphanomyces stellatus]|uniref:Aste57867_7924 protein n=1 Tax=Aphanomyces stellatus TaxID=120398 RepID=A0A485KJ03_9STRA|nr:hypothetical protein As57867_007894 [Aphanomyces stellatus]VFT84817.1 Aste57867_7924 [Aphanomyces stellatus]
MPTIASYQKGVPEDVLSFTDETKLPHFKHWPETYDDMNEYEVNNLTHDVVPQWSTTYGYTRLLKNLFAAAPPLRLVVVVHTTTVVFSIT